MHVILEAHGHDEAAGAHTRRAIVAQHEEVARRSAARLGIVIQIRLRNTIKRTRRGAGIAGRGGAGIEGERVRGVRVEGGPTLRGAQIEIKECVRREGRRWRQCGWRGSRGWT